MPRNVRQLCRSMALQSPSLSAVLGAPRQPASHEGLTPLGQEEARRSRKPWRITRWLLILGLPVLGLLGPIEREPAGISVQATAHSAPATQAGDCPSLCSLLSLRYAADPGLSLAGEPATVSISPRFVCRGIIRRMNIVLAASQSPALDRHDMREITSAMDRLLSQLDLPNNPSTRIAILDAPGEARTLVPLSNDEKLVRRGIHKVEMEGESNLASLLEEAGRHLRQGRADGCNEDSQEFLVLFAGDPDRRECVTAQRETNQLRRFGVRVITVCSGPRCRSGCMRDLASSARYAYSIRDASELIWVFGLIRDHIVNIGLRQLVVVEKLAAGGGFEPGSSSPAATWDVDAGTLTWQQNFVPRDGITVSYRTRPAGLGRVPVSGGLTLQWRDNQNRMGSATLNPPMVHVLGAPQSEP